MNEPMTEKRLAEIRAELEAGAASEDYYLGGMAPAHLGLELLAEVERLRAALRARGEEL
ncbi:MAG: hypothetical protein L0Z62_42025 [Gemmataceae bacterium]|nr:hypothetical protein [Gemmataceae bacterium]